MLNLENVLSRADEITIQSILGTQTVKILSSINDEYKYNSRLKDLIKDVQGKENLLLDINIRNSIIDLLKVDEAIYLAKLIGTYKNGMSTITLYNNLKRRRFTRGSSAEEEFFSFFNLYPPLNSKKNELNENIEQTGSYQLFKHQRDALRKIKTLLNTSPRRALLHMPTGSGKTRTAMNIIADHFRENEPSVVVWLAASEELCEQAAAEFEKAWGYLGDREINLYRFWGNSTICVSDINDGLIVAGLPKMVSSAKKSDGHQFLAALANKATLIIIDEAHQAVAETYSFILETLFDFDDNKKLLGLSATPGRTYNDIDTDKKLANFFSKKKVMLEVEGYKNPVDYLVDEGYISKVNYRQLFHEGGSFNDNEFDQLTELPKAILNKVGEDEQRNLKIVSEVNRLSGYHQRIILFAPSVDASDSIAFVLKALGISSYSLTSNTSSQRRKEIIEDFKNNENSVKVLCNYGVLTTGFDAPKTSAAIIARPTISLVLYSQMIGRAIRGVRAGGNMEAEIVTVIDQGLPGFRSVAESFMNWEDVWS